MSNSRKKVLIVVSYFAPYISGVSEYARAVAKVLSEKHDVTVLTGRHKNDLPNIEKIDGYTIVRATPLFFLDKGYISIDLIRKFRQLASKSDVINIHFPMLECGLLSLISNKPIILTYQCDMAPVGGWMSRLAVKCVQLSGRIGLSRAHVVPVLSADYAQSSTILNMHQVKLKEIRPPNRFEVDLIPKFLIEREENKGSDAPFICGFVGRFVEEKGISTILDAAITMSQYNVVFWLAGDYESVAGGSIFVHLKSRIDCLGDRIKLLGKLNDDELVKFYSTIDVLLLPSINRFEAFGMVQMEAMEFGAMVVTSDIPGVRDVVRETEMGELCEPNSATSLASAIERVIIRRQVTSRTVVRQALRKKFANERFTDSYMRMITHIIQP
jgi:glycosyltransferase involved in cell wall biosynthesis